ncbi:aminotransferase DegT [Archaeoglobales archaeon]|nr:MAG: aminotransferase DegT [Archaeoglobales archaeon]
MSGRIYLARPCIDERELEAVKKVLESKYLTEGPMTAEFEKKFAEYCEAKYGIATTSCSTALELALRTLGVGKGDEVIVPDFTYPATSFVVSLVGATPVLVDVDISSYNVTVEKIEEAITDRTKAIIPVSLFGYPLDEDVYKLKDEYGIYVIEDAACSAGAMLNGKKVGSQADMTCFSFHPRKVITTGEGGMITTNSKEFAERAKSLKRFGIRNVNGQIRFVEVGTNYKMSDILAAIGLVQLEKIEDIIKVKIEKAKVYTELLEKVDGIKPPEVRPNTRHTFQSYACYVEKKGMRDKIRQELAKNGVESQIGTYCLHLEPAFKDVKRVGKLENSEKLYYNLLTLPLHHELTLEQQEMICKIIKEVLHGG